MNARVEELFHEVADLSPADRVRYFGEHQVKEEIRQEVEALLAFDPGARSFLERDVRIAASRALPQLEGKGWRAGPYRLLDVIGRGGMGAVYLAERADGEVTQRLAVKLLPPGAGDPQRERFLQEQRGRRHAASSRRPIRRTGDPRKALEAYQDLRGRIMKSNPDPQNDSAQCGPDLAARSCAGRAAPPRGWDRRSSLPGSKPSGAVAALGPQAAE